MESNRDSKQLLQCTSLESLVISDISECLAVFKNSNCNCLETVISQSMEEYIDKKGMKTFLEFIEKQNNNPDIAIKIYYIGGIHHILFYNDKFDVNAYCRTTDNIYVFEYFLLLLFVIITQFTLFYFAIRLHI